MDSRQNSALKFRKLLRSLEVERGTVDFNSARSADSAFAASNLLIPRRLPDPVVSCPKPPVRDPEFLTPAGFYRFRWIELLGTLFSFYPLHLKNISAPLFADLPLRPGRFAARPMTASVVFHIMAYSLLPVLLQFAPRPYAEANLRRPTEVVYYRIPKRGALPPLPKLSPFGPGSTPGAGTEPLPAPAKGATASLAALFAVSRPHLADNNHQTVLQRNTPPDLRIKIDLQLPNLLIAKERPARPRVEYASNSAPRPLQPKRAEVKTDAPKLSGVEPSQSTAGLAPSVPTTEARLLAPIGNISAPVVPNAKGQDLSSAPNFAASGSDDGGKLLSGVPVAATHLGAPISGGSAPIVPAAGKPDDISEAPSFGATANRGQELLALSTNPGGPSDVVALPPGNRYGQFAIAPGTPGPGSPNGLEDGSLRGGVGGASGAGNDSSGFGKGTHGGGGSDSATSGFISMRGSSSASSALADPGPAAMAQQLVYALPISALMRHNRLVVSAGPIGGGGSNVYGELPCGKIYTVFLPTGGKPWPLQFCEKSDLRRAVENKARTALVQVEQPLVPPEATENYDFKRLPLPPEKAHKSIILRGAIDESGSVEGLEVHQGLLPAMDAAAKLAFSQWKFKPAMRSGKPVRVEILLAVPAD